MLFEKLEYDEQIDNLHRLHNYLNQELFGGKLSDDVVISVVRMSELDVLFWVDVDDTMMIFFSLEAVIRYKMLTRRIGETSSERLQLQWLVTSMTHAMVYQKVHEQRITKSVYYYHAQQAGLMSAGKRTEWISPVRFAVIERDFQLLTHNEMYHPDGGHPLPDSFHDDFGIQKDSSLPWW